jgi:hypothetical protein
MQVSAGLRLNDLDSVSVHDDVHGDGLNALPSVGCKNKPHI